MRETVKEREETNKEADLLVGRGRKKIGSKVVFEAECEGEKRTPVYLPVTESQANLKAS